MEARGHRKPRPQHHLRYRRLCAQLKSIREKAGLTQRALAVRLKWAPSQVAKSETGGRRIDPVELKDWCHACDAHWNDAMEAV
jgi:transcriptional regulator with XRE-family HTH domain